MYDGWQSDQLAAVLNDERRLAALRASGLLDIAQDERLDRLTRTAARAAGVPGAYFSILDDRNQVVKSAVGIPAGIEAGATIPVHMTLCRHVVATNTPILIGDTASEARLRNAAVAERAGVRAYASAPVAIEDGIVIGTCCMVDGAPRTWDTAVAEVLADYAAGVRDLVVSIALERQLEGGRVRQVELVQEARLAASEGLLATNDELERRRVAMEDMVEALRRSEARFRFLTEEIPVQLWTAQPDGHLDFVTEKTAAYFGKTAEQVVGDGWLAILHPDDVEHTVANWTRALQTGEPYENEFRLLCADTGEYRWHLARAVPFRVADGSIEKWYGSNTDIDDKKRVEAVLELARAAERDANLAKSRFLNMLSHELRTPLGAIGGYVDLLLMGIRGPLTDPQRADLERVCHNQKHLYALINDLLQLAKIEARQLIVHPEPARVSDLVAGAQAIVQPLLSGKDLTFENRAFEPDLKVLADPDRTQQILINLIGNAIRFTPAGGRITVEADGTDAAVRILVTDTGRGIPQEKIAQIFEPFVQANEKGDAVEGTGLGLAISRELARAMNGDLTGASRVGAGSLFTLGLPACRPDPEGRAPPAAAHPTELSG